MGIQNLHDLPTPALVLDVEALDRNLETMAEALPGPRLRPHVKAHKCTSLARRQAQKGHPGFTCATVREMVGLANAGLGSDLLLANECVDASRLSELAALDARVTVAVDSFETVDAAARAGVREVLVDVNVGLPRCGCEPNEAEALADRARRAGLVVRGVMGYEGHIVGEPDRERREGGCDEAMEKLRLAHEAVGGEVVSAGGTGTYRCNAFATEIQAGSYAVMDTTYAKHGLPFEQAAFLMATVISVSQGYAVCDAGLKSLSIDHGNPEVVGGRVWFCSDEHITFSMENPPSVGDRVRVDPAHCDPTIAAHAVMHCLEGESIVDRFEVDLRGW